MSCQQLRWTCTLLIKDSLLKLSSSGEPVQYWSKPILSCQELRWACTILTKNNLALLCLILLLQNNAGIPNLHQNIVVNWTLSGVEKTAEEQLRVDPVQKQRCELNANLLQKWCVSNARKTVEDKLRADLVSRRFEDLYHNLLTHYNESTQ